MSIQDGRCSGSSLALAERIQEKLERIVREKKTTAACAAVCGPEGLLAAACAGTRGFDDSPARVDDLYNVGSVSKIYVSAAVMKLVQEGRISLDEPVRRYLPDWRMADERCGEITVRMLLNHSSGIPGTNLHDHLDLEEEEELYTGKYRNTPAYWQTVKLQARPGSFSSYGNDGFDLVAEVVEAVTGKPYIRWLREQITGLVGPARGLSLAISATNDGDAPWLEVLEDIGGEVLKLIEKNGEDGVENQSSQTPEPGSSGKQSSQKPESDSIEKQSTLGLEPSSGENQSSQASEPGNIEKQSAQASEPAGIKQSALLEVPGRYSGLAYGSTSVNRFSVQEETLYTETLQKGGAWQREEGLSGFQWDGKAFVKGEHDRITAEEYDGKVYYIRWGVAFCQKNAGYPSPGALWPNLAGACFTAEGGEDIFGRICLESINEENVLIFTTEHEEYPVVPLVCDSRNEKETCLISETTRDGIVFRLEQEGDRTWLCTGTDRYVREV